MKIELEQECSACGGTGLYYGMGEGDGAGVVCHDCDGSGCFKFVHEYTPFRVRKPTTNVRRVFERNVGICIGEGNGHKLEDFGGMPFKDWAAGKQFPKGSENRKFTCPFWWYHQRLKVAGCDESRAGGFYSDCRHFAKKAECWKQFDQGKGK